ncbi:hypothetical protein V1520DRAFT_142814 [Lipomyces starkeyi]|uniref:Uncharacterized protein n=1 Tax=Lipomyces starkeyi NRRL Y-11557 TaxID=675824 RepID=A0A1E3Q2V3_LIPST|nr:hypothetical protein LIPSTDRAFT_105591 [Lipomyces starkeyi NRRL Y-11557]
MISSFRDQISGQLQQHSMNILVNNADRGISFATARYDPHRPRIVLSICYIVSFILVCCFIYDDCNQIFAIVQHPSGALASGLVEYIIKAILISAIIRLVCKLGLKCLSAYFYGFFYLRDVCAGVLGK